MNNESTGNFVNFCENVCEPFNVILIDHTLLSVQSICCDFSQQVRP